MLPASLLVSTLARFGLSFAILVVPCFLMGMTLPLLVRAVTESQRFIGSRIGALYCLNTLGAAAGCLTAGFWTAGRIGLRETNLIAVGVNFAIAIAALALSRPISRAIAPSLAKEQAIANGLEEGEPTVGEGLLLAVSFLNGLGGLACEVLWIRYMSFLVNSTYVFPTILCFYLLGLGLGGLVYILLERRIRRPARALGLVEVMLAISVPATFITGALIFSGGPPRPMGLKELAFITVSVPTVLMGVAFPLLCAVYSRRVQTLGRRVGLLFAVNTAGTVLGTLLPVFVLVPTVGIQKSITLVSVLYGVMGLAVLASGTAANRRLVVRAAIVSVIALVVFCAIAPSNLCQRVFLATDFGLARHTDILFYREGRTGTAIVTRDRANDCRTVYINGVGEVPLLYPHKLCFKMIGDLGPMLQANPDEVLMICFGGGVAAGATTQMPEVKRLTIVDLERSVVKAAKLLSEENNGLLSNPKAHVVIDDGRHYIMMSRRKWPVIISDSTHPKSGDSWVLYTQEFYKLVREHLTDDGVFVEWVPTHGLRTAEFKIIVRTFQSVFPHTSLWITHGIDEQGRSGTYSLLVATPEPLKIDVAKLKERLSAEAVRRDLEPFGLHTVGGFLDTFLCAEEKLRRWAEDGPVNTDDLPFTQYETSYSRGALFSSEDFIEPMEDVWPYLTGAGSEEEAGQLREELGLRAEANRLALLGQLEKAYAVLPEDMRYRQMRRIYEQMPNYVDKLADVYADNLEALYFLAGLRSRGPGGVSAMAPIYERILKLDPKNPSVLNKLGIMRVNAGLLREAEDCLKQAVCVSPGFADAHFNLGLCLLKQGRIAESVPYFSRAVELNPNSRDARLYFALALYRTGRSQEALPQVQYVLNTDPNDEAALSLLAEIEGRSASAPK
jgi:predicted membrane-bound spermidine synthase/tetratricopeptide (TPR) repeat protein